MCLELESYWKFRLESYFSSLVVFIIGHSFHKKRGLDIFLPHSYCLFLCRKVCCKKTFTLLWQEAHKIALKNLAQEEQLPKHHLNSACDFIYALFFRKLRQVRHFSSKLRLTSPNIWEYYPTLDSVASKIRCLVGKEKMPNKILVPILFLVDSTILGKKPGISCFRVLVNIKQV